MVSQWKTEDAGRGIGGKCGKSQGRIFKTWTLAVGLQEKTQGFAVKVHIQPYNTD